MGSVLKSYYSPFLILCFMAHGKIIFMQVCEKINRKILSDACILIVFIVYLPRNLIRVVPHNRA